MSRTEQEIRELYRSTQGMPSGPARFALLDEVVRHADALGLVEFAFDVRMSATQIFQHGGAPAKAFLTFSWCLAAYDREPARFHGGNDHNLLWQMKWMVSSVAEFPEIPLQRTLDLLDDMERRYRRGGHSTHAVLQHRGLVAEGIGALEQAQDFYEQMELTARDGLSDCSGCVPTSRVLALVALGRDEEAVRLGESAAHLGCTEQPQWLNSVLLQPLVNTGRGAQAVEAHRAAYRRIRDNPHHLGALALNVLFCARTGNTGRGLDLIERHLAWLDRPRTPMAAMEFAAAAVAVLSAAQAAGDGAAVLRFPSTGGQRRPDTEVAVLAAELRELALGIAGRFDARNGTTYQSTRVREWMGTTLVGEPVPLSVFERDLGARSGERVRLLVAQVAERTASGDLTGAARARAEAARELFADERHTESAEAAEEAVREFGRIGLVQEAAVSRWLLARAYFAGHERKAATGALRELLESEDQVAFGTATGTTTGNVPGDVPEDLTGALPPRPELEAQLGQWLGYSAEAAVWYLSAARGLSALGRDDEALAALGEALNRHPRGADAPASARPTSGPGVSASVAVTGTDPLAEVLAETRAVLGRLLADGVPAPQGRNAEVTALVLAGYAGHLRAADRLEEAAGHLDTAHVLLDGHGTTGTTEEHREALTELSQVRLLLGHAQAAEEAARAAIALLDDPDDAWEEAIALVRALRARGAEAEAALALEQYGLDEDCLADD